MAKSKNPHIGQSVDHWLKEEGIYEEATAGAIKKVVAWQLRQAMEAEGISKSKMARLMNTSRAQIDRLLDPEKEGVMLETLYRAATAVGRELHVELV